MAKRKEYRVVTEDWVGFADDPQDALEIIGYYHPTEGARALELYMEMAHSFHLNIETKEQQWARLTEDRIAKGTVVS